MWTARSAVTLAYLLGITLINIAVLLLLAASALAIELYRAREGAVAREQPSMNAQIIYQFQPSEEFKVIGREERGWLKVRFSNAMGYVGEEEASPSLSNSSSLYEGRPDKAFSREPLRDLEQKKQTEDVSRALKQVRKPPRGAASDKAKPPPANAPASDEKYLPCNSGPEVLRQIDAWEREGRSAADIRDLGRPVSEEALAERFISDCSQQLAPLSAAAGLVKDSPLQGLVNLWQTNLDFMKWWLQNRRSKVKEPALQTR